MVRAQTKKRPGKRANTPKTAGAAAAAGATKNNNYGTVQTGLAVVVILYAVYFFSGMQDTTDLSLAISESNTATSVSSAKSKPSLVKPTKPKLRKHPQYNESWTILQKIEAEQTGRVFAARPTLPPQRETRFMAFHSGVSKTEAYSGSWLQRTSDFMTMKIDAMEKWEDAAVFAYHDKPHDNRGQMLHMTLDLLDFR